MPKKGTPDSCPKCRSMDLRQELRESHIAITCRGCGHAFKSRSKIARRRLRAKQFARESGQ